MDWYPMGAAVSMASEAIQGAIPTPSAAAYRVAMGAGQDCPENPWRIAGFLDWPGQMHRLRAKVVQTSPAPYISTMPGGRAGTQAVVKWLKKNAKLHCSGRAAFETIGKPGHVNARRQEVCTNTQMLAA